MPKNLVRKVNLVFFQDDANGEWGLTHKETYNEHNSFNAFWDGVGIFHDVFEHAHEHTDKYFRGDAAMNVGGEMAAMGAMWYYYSVLGIRERIINRQIRDYLNGSDVIGTTISFVQEAIEDGYTQFGDRLVSSVPRQAPVDDCELEWVVEEYTKRVRAFQPGKHEKESCEIGLEYKQSCTFRRIADLHRYGFRMAQRLVPHNCNNHQVLNNFIRFWNTFCKRNPAEEKANHYRGIEFSIYRDGDGDISWKAEFQKDRGYTDDEIEDLIIRSERIEEMSLL